MTQKNNIRRQARGTAAERRGRWAEYAAMFYLLATGHALLGRRLRTPYGEVDILARRGDSLIVVEVKLRHSAEAAGAALSAAQQQRLMRAASHLAARHPFRPGSIRLDAILFAPPLFWPRHIRAVGG